MDDRLQKALDYSKYRISLFNRKEDLKVKLNTMLTHACNGGIFKIDRELINFVELLQRQGRDHVVLIDKNQNPIHITDISRFLDDIFSRYFEATNLYHSEYSKLKAARSVRSIYDFIEQ
jgi:hypothetical protein